MKKTIKKLLLMMFFATAVTLTSCVGQTVSNDDDAQDTDLYNPSYTLLQEEGLPMLYINSAATRRVGNTQYLFPTNDATTNTRFVNQTEALIREIGNLITIHNMPLNLHLAINLEQIGIREDNVVALSHDRAHGFGLFAYRLHHREALVLEETYVKDKDEPRLPFWLLAGIEAVSRKNTGLDFFNPITTDLDFTEIKFTEDFGDVHFLPIRWGTPGHLQAINTAYHFTTYLIEKKQFNGLVNMYVEGNRQEANDLAQKLFSEFANTTLNTSFNLMFGIQNTYVVTYKLPFSTTNFIIGYGDTRRLNEEDFRLHAQRFEEATVFVVDWYSKYFTWSYKHINHNVIGFEPCRGGIARLVANVSVSYGALSHQVRNYVAAHEVQHLVAYQINGHTSFTPFCEGMSMYMMWLFAGESQTWRNRDLTNYLRPSRQTFESLKLPFSPGTAHYSPFINSYETSGMFVLYLIEKHGTEKFLQVKWNVGSFERVYGMSLERKIDEWLTFKGYKR